MDLFKTVVEKSPIELQTQLRSYPQSFIGLFDQNHSSLLHLCAQLEKKQAIQQILRQVFPKQQQRKSGRAKLKSWTNELNSQEITALHIAVAKGNLILVKILINAGSSPEQTTPLGMNSLHIAAHGDFPQLVSYFLEAGMSINIKDNKGGTPLHWASFMGAYHATSVLLAFKCDINATDGNGHTPLHLSVIAGQPRIVRLLLLKGSQRDFRDNSNKTPKEIAHDYNYSSLQALLETPGVLQSMGYKPLLKPYKRTYNGFIVLMVLISALFVLTELFLMPCKKQTDQEIIGYALAGSVCTTILLALVIVSRQPGYIQGNLCELSVRFRQDLYSRYKAQDICPDCSIVRPERSRHCHYCDRCVARFDHHCQWLSTCIGARNIGLFYLFLLFIMIDICLLITLDVFVFISDEAKTFSKEGSFAMAILTGALSILFLIPVTYLVGVNTINLCVGKTTSQRYSRGRKDENQINRCFVVNCRNMCCNIDPGSREIDMRSTFVHEYQLLNEI